MSYLEDGLLDPVPTMALPTAYHTNREEYLLLNSEAYQDEQLSDVEFYADIGGNLELAVRDREMNNKTGSINFLYNLSVKFLDLDVQ